MLPELKKKKIKWHKLKKRGSVLSSTSIMLQGGIYLLEVLSNRMWGIFIESGDLGGRREATGKKEEGRNGLLPRSAMERY